MKGAPSGCWGYEQQILEGSDLSLNKARNLNTFGFNKRRKFVKRHKISYFAPLGIDSGGHSEATRGSRAWELTLQGSSSLSLSGILPIFPQCRINFHQHLLTRDCPKLHSPPYQGRIPLSLIDLVAIGRYLAVSSIIHNPTMFRR